MIYAYCMVFIAIPVRYHLFNSFYFNDMLCMLRVREREETIIGAVQSTRQGMPGLENASATSDHQEGRRKGVVPVAREAAGEQRSWSEQQAANRFTALHLKGLQLHLIRNVL